MKTMKITPAEAAHLHGEEYLEKMMTLCLSSAIWKEKMNKQYGGFYKFSKDIREFEFYAEAYMIKLASR